MLQLDGLAPVPKGTLLMSPVLELLLALPLLAFLLLVFWLLLLF